MKDPPLKAVKETLGMLISALAAITTQVDYLTHGELRRRAPSQPSPGAGLGRTSVPSLTPSHGMTPSNACPTRQQAMRNEVTPFKAQLSGYHPFHLSIGSNSSMDTGALFLVQCRPQG